MKIMKLAKPKPPIRVRPMNTGSRIRYSASRRSWQRLIFERFSVASVSGSVAAVMSRLRTAAPANTQKTIRHGPRAISPLPTMGAIMGDTEITSITSAMRRMASGPVCRSLMTARGRTKRTAPPRPCTSLNAVSDSTLGANAQPTEAAAKKDSPKQRGSLRPA